MLLFGEDKAKEVCWLNAALVADLAQELRTDFARGPDGKPHENAR